MPFSTHSDNPAPVVEDLLNYANHSQNGFPVQLVTKSHDIRQPFTHNETNRPSLVLFGYFDFFAYQRIQIFGRGEFAVLQDLYEEDRLENITKFFEYNLPCLLFSHDQFPDSRFIELADEKKVPVFVSSLTTNELTDRIYDFFSDFLYVSEVVRGLMMDIHGVGVLVVGDENLPSEQQPLSEYGLELIRRGFCLVADDVVNVKVQKGKQLEAFTSEMIAHHMNVTGLGIINVAHLFGVKSILYRKNIEFVVELVPHGSEQVLADQGKTEHFHQILNIQIPKVYLPLNPLVNVCSLIETATKNYRLKATGYNPNEEFNKRIIKYTHRKNSKNT